jgi:hypothetical protein
LSHCQAAGDARFGSGEIEQRLHQFHGWRLRRFRRHQDQNADALREKVARRSANRNDMGDHRNLCVGTPHGKRSVRLDALRFERLHRLSQLGVGSGVAQRKPILRSPVQVVAQSFRQFVGDENPSREIKDESRQPNRRQRRSRSAGALQLEPRRHEG